MNDLERRLKSLPTNKPSHMLRQRIFGQGEVYQKPARSPYSIHLGWATSFCLIAAIGGFLFGRLINDPTPTNNSKFVPSLQVQVIYEAPGPGNAFDFTDTTTDFLPGEITIVREFNGEV